MPELTLQSLPLLILLFVPGAVARACHGLLLVDRRPRQWEWMNGLCASALVLAPFAPHLPWMWASTNRYMRAVTDATNPRDVEMPSRLAVSWFIVVLIAPATFGLLAGLESRKGWARKFAGKRLGVSLLNPVAYAWDYAFTTLGTAGIVWMSATLKDGTIVEGVFGSESLSSSDAVDRDLYLESMYQRTPEGTLELVDRSAGVWLSSSEIKSLEFKWVHVRDMQP